MPPARNKNAKVFREALNATLLFRYPLPRIRNVYHTFARRLFIKRMTIEKFRLKKSEVTAMLRRGSKAIVRAMRELSAQTRRLNRKLRQARQERFETRVGLDDQAVGGQLPSTW
jgi:hypothetical protein